MVLHINGLWIFLKHLILYNILTSHIKEYQLDIVALTKTLLSNEDSKNKHVIDQCVAHGYTPHHSPGTSGRRGGGVGILVNNAINVTYRRIQVSPQITYLLILFIPMWDIRPQCLFSTDDGLEQSSELHP